MVASTLRTSCSFESEIPALRVRKRGGSGWGTSGLFGRVGWGDLRDRAGRNGVFVDDVKENSIRTEAARWNWWWRIAGETDVEATAYGEMFGADESGAGAEPATLAVAMNDRFGDSVTESIGDIAHAELAGIEHAVDDFGGAGNFTDFASVSARHGPKLAEIFHSVEREYRLTV